MILEWILEFATKIKLINRKKPIWGRVCEQKGYKERSCEMGWGSQGGEGHKSCFDEPVEDNCRNLIDVS